MTDDSLADKLFNAHLRFIKAQLAPPRFEALLADELDAALAAAGELTLRDLAAIDAVKKTARKYASDLDVGPAIPELVGEVGRALYDHRVHKKTRLQDLLDDRQFEEFLDKALELRTLREQLIHESVSNPIYSSLVSELLYRGIRDFVTSHSFVDRVPGAGSLLKAGKRMAKRATPQLESKVDETLRAFIDKSTRKRLKASETFLLKQIDDEDFRDVVLDFWHDHKTVTIGDLREFIGPLDIEEFFVIGYEFWRQVRSTDLYQQSIDTGIEQVYRGIGDLPLNELLKEIGIDRDMILDDLTTFAPPLIATLDERGLLDDMIRRWLQPFYQSDEVAKLLDL